MKIVHIYTDGSCIKNGTPNAAGGWAAIMTYKDKRIEFSGGKLGTTNNKMELRAVIEAIRKLRIPCDVTVGCDSSYVGDCIRYINQWSTEGRFRTANAELLRELREVSKSHKIRFQYIKGHSGHPENELCDKLAKQAALKIQMEAEEPMEAELHE